MSEFDQISNAFKEFFRATEKLKKLGITPNKKDFTSQVGEWLVEQVFDGKRSENGIQKYWDVKTTDDLIQVKTHSKAKTTSARWSSLKYDEDAEITRVVIVIFSETYELQDIYNIPWLNCLKLIRRNASGDVIYWDDVKEFKMDLYRINKQHIIKLFKP
jgi:hypothetical protein